MTFDIQDGQNWNKGIAQLRKMRPLRSEEYSVLAALVSDGKGKGAEQQRLENKLEKLQMEAILKKVRESNRPSADVLEAWELLDGDAYQKWMADKPLRSTAMSGADRVAKNVARRSNIGTLPAVVDMERREQAADDLVFFGITYCRSLLKHDPSDKMLSFIKSLAVAIRVGGQIHVRWPRGKGKTTWVKIAILWALLYGYRKYVVVFAATNDNAENIIADVWDVLETENIMCEDFPEFTIPIRAINGIVQRCTNQCYKNKRTRIEKKTNSFTLPTLEGFENGGSLLVARGWKSRSRGLVRKKHRPDFVFLDDLQTEDDSKSPKIVAKIETFIQKGVMGLAGHDKSIAAFMASTPINADDLSERFASDILHPEWITHSVKMLAVMPSSALLDGFSEAYSRDQAKKDESMSLSRQFYLDHKEEFAHVGVMDPLDGDAETEVDAIHHALNLYCKVGGRSAFMSEYQMEPQTESEVLKISLEMVAHAINNHAWCNVPLACRSVIGFCDVNNIEGFRWAVMAVGGGDICAVPAYGRYPRTGRLYEENSSEQDIQEAVARGMKAVVDGIGHLPLLRNGKPVKINAFCFDGGWQTATIARVLPTLQADFALIWSKGFGWSKYRTHNERGELRPKVVALGNYAHVSESGNGKFLAVQTDYWREVTQRSFLVPPLTKGSCSFWGNDKTKHYQFAQEIINEKLVDKGADTWRWAKAGENHWGDVLSGCFSVAGWYRFLDPVTTGLQSAGLQKNIAPRTQQMQRAQNRRRLKARYVAKK